MSTTSTPFPLSSSGTIQELPGQSPADIALSRISVRENRKNLKVAELQAIDEDPSTKYSLIDGIGSVDNSSFEIIGEQLYAKESFDYEEQDRYFIRVSSENSDGVRREEMLAMSVQDVEHEDSSFDVLTGLQVGAQAYGGAESSSGSYDWTSVNFINNTASGAFWVHSADNRFESFVLNPGASRRVTGTITGMENSDVNANINVVGFKPGRHSSYVGNIRFNNHISPYFGVSFPSISSDGKSFVISSSGRRESGSKDTTLYDYVLYTDGRNMRPWRPIRDGSDFVTDKYSGVVGVLDPGGLDDSVQFKHYYFDSVNGQKRWDFVATELPPS